MTDVFDIANGVRDPFGNEKTLCQLKNVSEPNLYYWAYISHSDMPPQRIDQNHGQLNDTAKNARALARFEIARRERERNEDLSKKITMWTGLLSATSAIAGAAAYALLSWLAQ